MRTTLLSCAALITGTVLSGCQGAKPKADVWRSMPPVYLMEARREIDAASQLAPAERSSERLVVLARMGEELGARDHSAVAYLQAAVLEQLHAETDAALGWQRLPQVEYLCQQALRLDPSVDHAGPYRVLGKLYAEAPANSGYRNLKNAREHFGKAVELAPDFPGNWLGLADVLYELGEPGAAHQAYLQAVQAQPRSLPHNGAERDRQAARQRLAERFPSTAATELAQVPAR